MSPGGSGSLGALLHLGPIVNTVRVWLNGAMVPAVDVSDAVVDVSAFVKGAGGENEVRIEVASTLFNRVKADGNRTWTAGVTANEYKDFGLLGPVWVEWVEEVVVA